MMQQIIVVVIILIFFILIVAKVAVDIIALVVNGAIIYALGMRSFKEVKAGEHHLYMVCGLLSLFLLLLFGNLIGFLWPFTSFLMLTCLFVYLTQQVKEKYDLS